ncbi:SDR family NAD(P)-dependent oxidoreductase [Streptomyces sp. NPDC093991]|uniref:SDR family NAD(P)-dependent oxidoreductase n=1 Tax=Streptomyces sp. NPDC093991 TaxID=3155078 RepID=UPI00343A5313
MSNLTGEPAGAELLTAAYWVRHVREAVRFADGVAWLSSAGVSKFLELGPDATLTAMGAECVQGEAVFVAATRREHDEVATLTQAVSRLWGSGVEVDWTALFAGRNPGRVDLPTYAFQRRRYWLDRQPAEETVATAAEEARFWEAVEREDVTALAATLESADEEERAALRAALPPLAAWRRRRRGANADEAARYTVTWRPVEPEAAVLKGRWLVVVPEGSGAADVDEAVVAALTAAGADPVILPVPREASGIVERVTALAATGEGAGTTVDSAPFTGVLSLLGCDPDSVVVDEDGVSDVTVATVALLHALTATGIDARVWCATRGGVAAAPGEEAPAAGIAALWGLGRVAALELPDRWGGLVDLPASRDERTGGLLAAVLRGQDGEDQVAIRRSGLLVRRLTRVHGTRRPASARGEAGAPDVPWPPRGTVLITGGTGALGAHVARDLAGAGAEHLLLVSRRGPEAPGARELAAELRAAGAEVTVEACDVADRDQLAGVLAGVPGDRPLTAVVHTAGVIEDGVLDALTPDSLRHVARPKVAAARNLHELTSGLPLTAFVLFSSLAGTTGTLGQAAYGAANAELDALAARRRAAGLPAISVAWGAWAGDGMAGGLNKEAGARRVGMLPLTPARAVTALRQILGGGDAEDGCVAVADLDWELFAPAFTTARPSPLLADLPEARRALAAVATARNAVVAGAAEDLVARLASLPVRDRERAVIDVVRGHVAGALGHASAQGVDPERQFKELGFDSLTAVDLRNRLTAATGLRLPSTMVFDHPTTTALARELLTRLVPEGTAADADGTAVTAGSVDDDPIAIVGMACRLPGGVNTPEDLWELLAEGRDVITPCPDDRGWDIEDYYDPDPERPGSTYGRAGGFMDGADSFDAAFFGISPREALAMDPQQRLLLETSWETIERAGIDPHALRGTRTGVFVGLVSFDYARSYGPGLEELQGFLGIGNSASVASGRVAYTLGLEGQALTVDTACSSSLVALHLAARALRDGECTMALAGGATVLPSPSIFLEFSRQRGLSTDGRCHAFSSDADGFGPAEGVGMLLLERLSDARRNGHRVLALVRGSAVNQDGASNGLTAPNGPSQQRVIRQALADAGLTPADVDAVEAHGTGTTLGDPIEAQALLATYGQERPEDRPLWLGSVKSNLGHTQAAAGVTGVIKMVMAMREGVLPRTLHVEEPTPHVDWSTGAVELLSTRQPWPETGRPRRAGVSSFGISGTNAHVILEAPEAEHALEKIPAPVAPPTVEGEPVLRGQLPPWLLSARDAETLRAQAGRVAGHAGEAEPADIGWALLTQRARLEHRAVLGGTDGAELRAAARALAVGEAPDAAEQIVTGRAQPSGGVTFVFPGQGSQWLGMGRELLATSPVFAARMAACEQALAPFVEWRLTELLGEHGPEERWADWTEHVEIIQPVLWAVMVSLATVWEALGVTPSAVVGHSQGEIAAAVVAGALGLEDGARVVTARSRLAAPLTARGQMLSVGAGEADVAARLARFGGALSVGAVNGPASTVVAGTHEALDELVAELEAEGVWCRRVAHTYASHSPQMEELEDALSAALRDVTPGPSRLALVSTVTGELQDAAALDAAYWYRNLREPVAFRAAIETALELGHTTLVEVSPHPVLVGVLQEIAEATGTTAVVAGTLRRNDGGPTRLVASAAELWVSGVDVDWSALWAGTAPRRVELPTYPFRRQRYWLTGQTAGAGDPAGLGLADSDHPLLGAVVRPADGDGLLLTARLSPHSHPWLGQHRVLGTALLPGTALVELAVRAGDEVDCGHLRELLLRAPLVLPDHGGVRLQVVVGSPAADGTRRVTVHSQPQDAAEDQPWTCHAEGLLAPAPAPDDTTGLTGEPAADLTAWPPLGAEPVELSGFYAGAERAGYGYGPAFYGLRAAWRRGDETFAEVALPEAVRGDAHRYGLHPALLDAALQAAGLPGVRAGDSEADGSDGGDGEGQLWQPFAWTGVTLLAAGATDLRVRLAPAHGTDDGALRVSLADTAGRPVAEVAALVQRPVDAGQIAAAAARDRGDALLRIDWEEPAHTPQDGDTFATWAVLGEDRLDLAVTVQDTGRPVTTHADLDGLLAVLDAGVPAPAWAVVPCGGRPSIAAPSTAAPADAACGGEPSAGEETARVAALLERWLAEERLAGVRLAVVTRGGLAATGDADLTDPQGAAVRHLLSAVRDRHPGRVTHLDLDGTEAADRAEPDDVAVALETAHAAGEPSVALRGGTLLAPRAHRLPDTATTPQPELGGTVVLTTAGGGSLGAAVAHRLVATGTLRELRVLAPATDGLAELRAALDAALGDALRDHDVPFAVHTGDVDDAAWLARHLTDPAAGQPATAVVDTTGDPAIAFRLHELLSDAEELTEFAVFAPEPDALLDVLAHRRRATGLPVTVVTGAPWDARDKAAQDAAAQATEDSARTEARADALVAALGLGQPPLLVTRLDTRELRRRAEAGTLPAELRALASATPGRRRSAAAPGAGGDADPAAGSALLQQLAGLTPAERVTHLTDLVRRQAAAVLGHGTAEAVEGERQFKDIGFDSMMSVQLRNRLGGETGLTLPATVVFTYPTPAALAAHLAERLPNSDGAPAAADGTDRVLAEIERLDAALARVEADLTDEAARTRVVKRLQSVLWRWTGNTATADDTAGGGVLDGSTLHDVTDDEMFDLIDRELGA